jgi:hypothetical protein
MKVKWYVVALVSMGLMFTVISCQIKGFPKATPQSTNTPNFPVLKVVSDFIDGNASIPEDKVLFLEVQEDHINIGDCIGPQSSPPIYYYRYENGILSLDSSSNDVSIKPASHGLGIIGYHTKSRYENPNDAWCTQNCGEIATNIFLMGTLPYTLTIANVPQVIVRNISSNGDVIVEIEEKTYLVEPGQSWNKVTDVTFEADSISENVCHRRVSTYKLINQGLIAVRNIEWQKQSK